MALDRTKLHKGFTSYLNNAEQASGKKYDDFALALSKSGLKSHGDLRAHIMDTFGVGHGHANAVVHIWREFDGGDALIGSASAKTAKPAKKAAKAPVKKAAKAAKKAPPKKK
jgi:hypothetical protein